MEDNNLEIPTPLGPAKLRGKDMFPWVLIAILMTAMGWLIHFSLQMWGDPFNLKAALSTHANEVQEQHAVNAYIMSVCLNPARLEECKQLDIVMPESLRKNQRRDSMMRNQ